MNAPDMAEGDALLFDEPGRIIQHTNYAVDYTSHYFRVVKGDYGPRLLVRNGLGDKALRIDKALVAAVSGLDSDARYLALYALADLVRKEREAGYDAARKEYQQAFVDGKLKKRKVRGQNVFRVSIEA